MQAHKLILLFTFLFLTSCAAHILQDDHASEVLKTDEYDQKLNIKVEESPAHPPPEPVVKASTEPTEKLAPHSKKSKKIKKSRKDTKSKAAKKVSAKKAKSVAKGGKPLGKDAVKETSDKRQPEMEDSVGMIGRRPLKDPFRVGEKVTLALSYFNIVAGNMEIGVLPFVNVNDERAYHFEVTAKSNSFFGHIYSVDDRATTYLSYDRMIPLNLKISIKESKQLAETRTFFDWKTLRASYWQKKITKDHGEQSKKLDWDIKDFSQNVISAAYYMRIFAMEPGKNLAFRVADEGKNIVFKGEVLRREKLQTKIGELNTIVVKPTLTVDGVFTPVGEIVFWLTDDDRKFIVRIESKIKIGTIVAKLESLEKGKE